MVAPPSDAVAIVTGGSYAIGREIARMLAHRGYAIVVVYLDDQRRAEATVDEILAADGTAVTVRADVTDDLDVERLFEETIAAFGAVDALVHTGTGSVSILYQQAVRHLGRGAAIVSVCTPEEIPPALARQLRERDITVVGWPTALEDEGAGYGVADLISLLDRSRRRPTR